MYRFVRGKDIRGADCDSSTPPRLFMLGNPTVIPSGGVIDSRIQERNRTVVSITIDEYNHPSRVLEESRDGVTRVLVNEMPDRAESVRGGQSVGVEKERTEKSRQKVVKRRRNVTEEETVTVHRRIRRVKGRSLVLEDLQVPSGPLHHYASQVFQCIKVLP